MQEGAFKGKKPSGLSLPVLKIFEFIQNVVDVLLLAIFFFLKKIQFVMYIRFMIS